MTCQSCNRDGYRRYVAGYFIDRHYGVHDHKFVAVEAPTPAQDAPELPLALKPSPVRLPASPAREETIG